MKESIINLKIQCDVKYGFKEILDYILEYESVFISMGIDHLDLKMFRDGYKVYGKTTKDPRVIRKLDLGVGEFENSVFDDQEDTLFFQYFPERRKPILKLFIPCDTRIGSIDKAKNFLEHIPRHYDFDICRGSNFGLIKKVRCSDGYIFYSKPDDRKYFDGSIHIFPENTRFSIYDFEEKNGKTMEHFFEEIVLCELGILDKKDYMKLKDRRRRRSYAKKR